MILETARMVLRPLEPGDLDSLMEIFADPVAMRYYPSTKTREEGAAWLAWCRELTRTRDLGLHAAVLRADGSFAGQCGLVPQVVDGREELEIGYLFQRRFWHQGLATEAAQAWREHGFALGARRLISLIHPDNTPSIRVAERNGMSLDRETTWKGHTVLVYAVAAAGPERAGRRPAGS